MTQTTHELRDASTSLVPETIPLLNFLHASQLFVPRGTVNLSETMRQNNPNLLYEQQAYLMSLIQKENMPRILLRKIIENGHVVRFEVLDGWMFVNTLIRFFKNEIPMAIEIRKYFPAAFGGVDVNMTGVSTNESISIDNFCYFRLTENKEFSEFINTVNIQVFFIE